MPPYLQLAVPLIFNMVTYLRYKHGVATISRLLQITRLFCRISSLLQGSFAKETYSFKEPTHRCHPIGVCVDFFHLDIQQGGITVGIGVYISGCIGV